MSQALTVFERSRWQPSSAITSEHPGCRVGCSGLACSSPSAAISYDDLAHDMGSRRQSGPEPLLAAACQAVVARADHGVDRGPRRHTVLDNDVLPERGIEALAAVFYVSNWLTIASDVSYFQRFSGPGPLDHLWSLAVEEQFYLLWPLVLLLLIKTLRRVDRMAQVTLGLAAVSFLLMLLLAAPGSTIRVPTREPTRAPAVSDRAPWPWCGRPRSRLARSIRTGGLWSTCRARPPW